MPLTPQRLGEGVERSGNLPNIPPYVENFKVVSVHAITAGQFRHWDAL